MEDNQKCMSIAVRRLRGLGYRVADVSQDERHKGYDLIGWKNGVQKRIEVKPNYNRTPMKVSRKGKSLSDITVVAMVRTGTIEIIGE